MCGSRMPVIVVGVSGSAASAAALRWAATEARVRGAQLVAVRAWMSAHPAFYAVSADHHDAEVERHSATSELARTLRGVFGTKPPPTLLTEVIEGMPERVLAERSAGADLLVLGSTSAATYAGRSAGPVIRSCLSRAHCPVVVIAPDGLTDASSGREPTTETVPA